MPDQANQQPLPNAMNVNIVGQEKPLRINGDVSINNLQAQKDTYEYKLVPLMSGMTPNVLSDLNKLGNAGWQLIYVRSASVGQATELEHCVFIRKQ